jgi:hypothetical protein
MEKKPVSLIFLALSVLLMACLGTTGQEADPDELFFDYKIWGEEGNDSVTVMLFYREEGPTGPTVRIDEPGFVELDGERLLPDSNMMTGVFYTVRKEVKQFTGKHSILYTDVNQKSYREDFDFSPFTLKEPFRDTLQRVRLQILLEGLDKMDVVRVLLSDTSYPGDAIERLDTIWNNELIISKSALTYLNSGPVYLELSKEDEWPVEKGTRTGGLVSVTYTLRRELFLLD